MLGHLFKGASHNHKFEVQFSYTLTGFMAVLEGTSTY